MGISSYIAKLWREVFGQESLALKHAPMHPTANWIRERVHAAIGEEALLDSSEDRGSQASLSSAFFSLWSSVNRKPAPESSTDWPERAQMNSERRFEEQQSADYTPQLLVGWCSDPGITRRHKPNEDSFFAARCTRLNHAGPETLGLFIVADGMGGHAFGREASCLGIQSITEWILPRLSRDHAVNAADCKDLLTLGVQKANRVLYQRNQQQSTEMGTTITAVLILDYTAFVVNVGDSRTYLYREATGLRKVTRDHSLVAQLVEFGIIQPNDIYCHPQRNSIYRSLGTEPVIQVDAFTVPLQPGDTLLLCSDGLWEMVRDAHIQEIVRNGAVPPQTCQALVEAALKGGGTDNITAIVVHVAPPPQRHCRDGGSQG